MATKSDTQRIVSTTFVAKMDEAYRELSLQTTLMVQGMTLAISSLEELAMQMVMDQASRGLDAVDFPELVTHLPGWRKSGP